MEDRSEASGDVAVRGRGSRVSVLVVGASVLRLEGRELAIGGTGDLVTVGRATSPPGATEALGGDGVNVPMRDAKLTVAARVRAGDPTQTNGDDHELPGLQCSPDRVRATWN